MSLRGVYEFFVVCDTAKVRFFKQITTEQRQRGQNKELFAILQKYDFSSKSQLCFIVISTPRVVCDTAKVRFFKQITTKMSYLHLMMLLFAILQKYDFSSKSQQVSEGRDGQVCCLRYCKSTIFQANHNNTADLSLAILVVCDTAKVRFFKQITTAPNVRYAYMGCLRYCKSTIFQANHNSDESAVRQRVVVCDTAKVRFFKQITTSSGCRRMYTCCLRYCKSTIFQANHNSLRE